MDAQRRITKKILPKYFKDVVSGDKTFELREDSDNIAGGDILVLREWNGMRYTGAFTEHLVTYVLRNTPEYGLMDGYCIIAISPPLHTHLP